MAARPPEMKRYGVWLVCRGNRLWPPFIATGMDELKNVRFCMEAIAKAYGQTVRVAEIKE